MFQGKDPCFQQLGQFSLANGLVDDACNVFIKRQVTATTRKELSVSCKTFFLISTRPTFKGSDQTPLHFLKNTVLKIAIQPDSLNVIFYIIWHSITKIGI